MSENEPESAERIARMSREEVDALPYGLMLFDPSGTVHLYNRYESLLSRRQPADVVGKSWFREVAPCTRVGAFEGRFRAFVERDRRDEVLRFAFRFHFLHGAQDVEITFAHAPEPERVFVIVARRALSESGRPHAISEPVITRLDEGRSRGGLGSALPAPRLFWARLFEAVDPAALADAAASWGDALLQGVEAQAAREHGAPLGDLPAPLAVALIDEAFAAQGLGRIELDFGGAAAGVLGFVIRGVDLPLGFDELLYASILRALTAAMVGRELEVVVFARRGELLRLAATTSEKAKVIRALRDQGRSARDIAMSTGLEVWD